MEKEDTLVFENDAAGEMEHRLRFYLVFILILVETLLNGLIHFNFVQNARKK